MADRDEGVGVTEVERVVALLLELFHDASPEWAVSYVAQAKAEPHRGDCVLAEHQGPITCDRCVWEECSAKARRLIEAARPSPPDEGALRQELEGWRSGRLRTPADADRIDHLNKALAAEIEVRAAAETALAEARGKAIEECFTAIKAVHQPFAVHGVTDGQFEDTVQARTLRALATALAPSGGARSAGEGRGAMGEEIGPAASAINDLGAKTVGEEIDSVDRKSRTTARRAVATTTDGGGNGR